MDIKGTDGDDKFVQSDQTLSEWNNYLGGKGNDSFKIYQGTALGGAGNDTIERLSSSDWWRTLQAAYWDSPAGVVVDLAAGWAEDGWGTRDTLIGVRDVAGSWKGDRLYLDGADNIIYLGGGGSNLVDGRGGNDTLWLPVFNQGMKIDEFTINVSIDGKTASISWSGRPEFSAVANNIERIGVWAENSNVTYALADLIKSEDLAIQGLLAGPAQRWNATGALGSAAELTYSFVAKAPASGVGAAGFQTFTEAQRASVRAILDSAAQATGLSFREVSGSGADGTNLRFGASQQTATKGVAAMPGEANAGQVWMDVDSLLNLAPGSEGYAALLHEIGHALGLRHPRNVQAGDAYAAQWRVEDDHTSLSVMSQTASADGQFPSTWGALDIHALRHLYGGEAVNGGDTVHLLDTLRFQSHTAIVDDGGNDTISAAQARAGVSIDLAPGHLSSAGVGAAGLIAVGNLALAPDSWIEAATGSDFDDVLLGNKLDNALRGGTGNDWLDGKEGSDSAVFAGMRSQYSVSTGFGKVFVGARDGVGGFDTLLSVERLVFSDATLVLGASALGSDLSVSVDQNASIGGKLPAAGDATSAAPASYKLKTGPAYGTLTLSKTGDYVYTPRTGFSSEDAFSYTLSNAQGGSNEYMVFVSVREISAGINGSAAADKLAGGAGNDIIDAGAGNDQIAGSTGSDALRGGDGLDAVRYLQSRAGVAATVDAAGTISVSKGAGNGTDTLTGVERIVFSDGAIAFDVDGNAGQVYRLYQAAFDRKPAQTGLGYWVEQMDRGMTLNAVASAFIASDEFVRLYGAHPSDAQFVNKLYSNVLHRAPKPAGFEFWLNALESGQPRADALVQFAESPENQAQVIGSIQAGMLYTPYLG